MNTQPGRLLTEQEMRAWYETHKALARGGAMRHTPGPWKWNGRHCIDHFIDGRVVPIAQVVDSLDAFLIAAAPDLLAALKDCVDSLEYVDSAHPGTTGYGVRAARIKVALVAIAKAEGAR